MSKTYEMQWDCEFCGSKKLLGKTHRHCPSCGAAQDPEQRYFPEDDEKVAVEDHEYIGADKVCPSCDAPNSAKAACCTNCGSPMDGSKQAELKQDPSADPSDPSEEGATKEKTQKKEPQGPQKKSKLPIFLAIGGVIILILIILFSIKTEKEATVSGHSWERSIEVERYQVVEKEAWQDKIPSDGHRKSCKDKEKDTKKIEDGQECKTVKKDNGDGTFNEKEECKPKYKEVPVYEKWCKYEVNDWKQFDTLKASGTNIDSVKWPVTNIRKCNIKALNCEREGNKDEQYTVIFKDSEGKTHNCNFKYDKWKSAKVGVSQKLKFGKMSGNLDCTSFEVK